MTVRSEVLGCPSCGVELESRARFCSACGTRIGAPDTRLASFSLSLALAGPLPLVGIATLFRFFTPGLVASLALGGSFGVFFVAGVLLELSACVVGVVAYRRALRAPTEYGGKSIAAVGTGLGAIPVVLLGGWLVAPLLRAGVHRLPTLREGRAEATRPRGEASDPEALLAVRALIRAQTRYARMNGMSFGTLACLTAPRDCLPGYVGPAFLDPASAVARRNGYRFELRLGPEALNVDRTRVVPGSRTRFAYVATPVGRGRAGTRSYCGEGNGLVRAFDWSERDKVLEHGRCERVFGTTLETPQIASVEVSERAPRNVEDDEATALADARATVLAEKTYARLSGGAFEDQRCLVWPGYCLSNYDGPGFLEEEQATPERRGYRRMLEIRRGPDNRPTGFIFVATPLTSSETGRRVFCADERGVICALPPGESASVSAGGDGCPPVCVPLERIDGP